MLRRLGIICFIGLCVSTLMLAYNFMRSNIAVDFYRDRLRDEVAKREALRQNFNEVVKKTVVTELLVNDDDSVCIVFVNVDNTERVVPTPFKKGAEVFVDFIVQNNLLFLRRVFDENTKPKEALYINPDLQTVDWKANGSPRGAATYAQLNDNGRYVVSVAGNGALEIRKADKNAKREPLVAMPTVKDYELIEKEMNAKVDEIGMGDVMKSLFGSKK